jgi:hypothetical protein
VATFLCYTAAWKAANARRRRPRRPGKTFQPLTGEELLQYTVGDYPWDRWATKAQAAGVPLDLVNLGRSLMREAVQHSWGGELQQECGWADEGAAMIALALNDPGTARKRWDDLLRTDGGRVEPQW